MKTELTRRPSFRVTFRKYTLPTTLPRSSNFTGPPRRFDVGGAKRGHQCRPVFHLAIDGLDGGFEHRAVHVSARCIKSRIVFELLAKSRRESLVRLGVELGRIPAGGDDIERFVTHVAQHRFVERGHSADHLHLVLQAVVDELPQKTEAVQTGEAEKIASAFFSCAT